MSPVGVLALQGGVSEHCAMTGSLGLDTIQIRTHEQLEGISALLLPGGESTTLISLMDRWGLTTPVRELGQAGLPILGTCAGAVLLSSEVSEVEHACTQESLRLASVRSVRNRFGRQTRSFIRYLNIKGLDAPFPGLFIRAPLLEPLSDKVEILAELSEGPVLLRQGNLWLSSFHPELTTDTSLHRLFFESIGILPGRI